MNTRRAGRAFVSMLFAVILTFPFLTRSAATQSAEAGQPTVNVETANGLRVVTFSAAVGTVRVYLPEDIRAGDTISGTVVAEPNGKQIKQFVKQSDSVEGQVVVVGNQKVPVSARQSFVVFLPGLTASGAVITPDPKITQPTHPSGAIITPDPKITTPPNTTPPGGPVVPGTSRLPDLPVSFFDVFLEPSGGTGRARIPLGPPRTHPSGAIITPDPKITPPTHPSGAIITPDPKITKPIPDAKIMNPEPPSGEIITIPGTTFGNQPDDIDELLPYKIPPLGQTGKPIVITGPFDGNSSNTLLEGIVPTTGATMDTPETYYAYPLIAESPRNAVFETPKTVTGPVEVKLKEGTVETRGTTRTLGVVLSARKTSLLKGESTELNVEVLGLQGIKQPVPLTLESNGVITMEGGMYQPLVIQPSQVSADGRYSTTRGVTGLRAGGWSATATVMIHQYDYCLRDDSNPQTVVLVNSSTGKYSFTLPNGSSASGTGSVERRECGLKLKDKFTDKPFQGDLTLGNTTVPTDAKVTGAKLAITPVKVDGTFEANIDFCAGTGSAELSGNFVEVDFHKRRTMTVRDRNITDNPCPGQ